MVASKLNIVNRFRKKISNVRYQIEFRHIVQYQGIIPTFPEAQGPKVQRVKEFQEGYTTHI